MNIYLSSLMSVLNVMVVVGSSDLDDFGAASRRMRSDGSIFPSTCQYFVSGCQRSPSMSKVSNPWNSMNMEFGTFVTTVEVLYPFDLHETILVLDFFSSLRIGSKLTR